MDEYIGADDRRVLMQTVESLRTNPRNARVHSPKQIKQIADSIRTFGFVNPILIDETNMVLAGHGRLAAAKRLKLATIPTLAAGHLTDVQKRAYVLADNRLAEKAGWNRDMLSIELGELAVLLPSATVDWTVEITGFAAGEIEVLGHDRSNEHKGDDEAPAVLDRGTPITRHGDLWLLGPHRLLCGDARSAADIDRLMDGARAKMVFTDPPYNVPIAGHVTRAQNHPEFAMASGEMTEEAFGTFLGTCLGHAVRVSAPGAIHDVCMDWRHIAKLTLVGQTLYDAMLNLCVWNKGAAGQGSFYRSQHELIAIFRVAGGQHQNNVALGEFGRNRSNIWTYPGVVGFGRERAATLAMHPTVKPVAMVADAIRDCTFRDELVLDPFLGSGTTLIAAEKIGRRCHGLEYDPIYVDGIVRRWQSYTGYPAALDNDGSCFDEVLRARGPD